MRLKSLVIVIITVISFVIGGCTKNDVSIIEQIQKQFPSHRQDARIIHTEIFGNGLLVFYRRNGGLGSAFFQQQSDHWEWVTGSGYAPLNPDDGLSIVHSNRNEISLYLSYGIITDPDISEVNSLGKRAKIIQTAEGTKIWFITYQEPIGQEGSLPPINGVKRSNSDKPT